MNVYMKTTIGTLCGCVAGLILAGFAGHNLVLHVVFALICGLIGFLMTDGRQFANQFAKKFREQLVKLREEKIPFNTAHSITIRQGKKLWAIDFKGEMLIVTGRFVGLWLLFLSIMTLLLAFSPVTPIEVSTIGAGLVIGTGIFLGLYVLGSLGCLTLNRINTYAWLERLREYTSSRQYHGVRMLKWHMSVSVQREMLSFRKAREAFREHASLPITLGKELLELLGFLKRKVAWIFAQRMWFLILIGIALARTCRAVSSTGRWSAAIGSVVSYPIAVLTGRDVLLTVGVGVASALAIMAACHLALKWLPDPDTEFPGVPA